MTVNKKSFKLTPFKKIALFSYDTVKSTNLLAKDFAREHGSEAVFIAAGQTGGRGRLGRSFSSEHGAGLYMSILIHPNGQISDVLKLTALAGVAVSRAIEKNTELSPKIKWVNDIQICGKKVAGILAEGEFDESGALKYAVIGIGLNVHKRDFGELSDIAAALGDFIETPPSIDTLFRDTVREFYRVYRKRNLSEEVEYYREHSSVIGRDITAYSAGKSYSAYATDIDESFALIVNDGEKETPITSAEVSIRVVKNEKK